MRRVAWWLVVAIALAATAGCSWLPRNDGSEGAPVPAAPAENQLHVVATVYPLAAFAEEVAGDQARVTTLVQAGSDPHSWEPTAATVRAVGDADVFLFNGTGLEPWVDRLLGSVDTPPPAIAVSAALPGQEPDVHDAGEHGHGDPHVWLDPVLAQQQVAVIAEALAEADPANGALYADNARRLQQKLRDLDGDFRTLAACPEQTIVITSPYFTHPAARYGLQVIAATTNSGHDTELRPGELARLISDMRAANIRHIFAETADDRMANTIARETDGTVLVLHPLESLTRIEQAAGADYFTLMEANLNNLRTGLGCAAAGG